MALRNDTTVHLKWGKMPERVCANLPWPVELTAHAVDDKGSGPEEEPHPLTTAVSLRAIRSVVALEENFANCKLGKWKVTCETHYEYDFDTEVSATGHPSMFLKGGNDSNFGMVMTVLPSKGDGAYEDESEIERSDLDKFQPARVTFYVRTDSPTSDAGHFILGESNEVNRRVAQFQFTRDGTMGLLGSGGSSYGSVPYEPHTWYRIDLTFNWERKEVDFYVNCKLEECDIPFRRISSNYIGACALGNRDRCTTWFDSFAFILEEEVAETRAQMTDGRLNAWVTPVMREEELWLHAIVEPDRDSRGKGAGHSLDDDATASATGAFLRWGPFTPVSGREVAQRHALNERALDDMSTMLDDESTADVEFHVGDDRIYAHRVILAARCEALRAMLRTGMAEGLSARASGGNGRFAITVREVRPPVFRTMIEFIYGGALDVDPDMAVELLQLADQYMLPDLKVVCGFALRRSITVETVCRVIQAADRFDSEDSELRQQCLTFILNNYEQVVGCPMWEELAASPQLLLQITRALALVKKEHATSPAQAAHNTRKRAREHS